MTLFYNYLGLITIFQSDLTILFQIPDICQDEIISLVLFHLQPPGGALGFSSDVFIMDAVGGGDMNLGELADLTVANDNDLSMDVIAYFVLINTNYAIQATYVQ